MKEKTKRPALGRGLKALLPGNEESVPLKAPSIPQEKDLIKYEKDELLRVNINIVRPSPTQPRQALDEDLLEELASSIREKGLLNPIIVRKTEEGIFHIIAGERRWRACGKAGMTTIPVIVKETTELEAFELALIENIQREDLSPLDEAESYKHILTMGNTSQEDVAKRVGKQRSTVTNSLRLLLLPGEVKTMLRNGSLTAGHARALLSLKDESRMIDTAEKVVKKGMSVRATEKLVKDSENTPKSRKKKESSGPYREIEDTLRKSLGTRVKFHPKTKSRGSISIEYYSLDQLEQLMKIFQSGDNDGDSDSEW
ncbi:MAG: ParB/RepB/Spo0J family partition protein [Deltaproteobacteria bacterium]|nr:ParB/RepB/Spo0J family partition protein [Deltaproteobacteria bacterium]